MDKDLVECGLCEEIGDFTLDEGQSMYLCDSCWEKLAARDEAQASGDYE